MTATRYRKSNQAKIEATIADCKYTIESFSTFLAKHPDAPYNDRRRELLAQAQSKLAELTGGVA